MIAVLSALTSTFPHWLSSPVYWLARFVRARFLGWGFIAVLALIAYFSARMALEPTVKAASRSPSSTVRHLPDFTAKHFTIWRNSLDGSSQYQLQAQSMTHYRDDLSTVLLKPVIHITTAPAKPNGVSSVESTGAQPLPALKATNTKHARVDTHIVADHGWVRNDGELIQLTQQVKVTRKASGVPTSTLQSASLVLLPDTDWVATHSPVLLTQGKNVANAQGGLEYTHSDAVLDLLGPVRMTLPSK